MNEWIIEYIWVAELAGFSLFLFAINFALKKILVRSKQKARLKEDDWRSSIDFAALLPARVLLWIFFLTFALDLFAKQFDLGGVFEEVVPLRNAGIVLCSAWFLIRWKKIFYQAMAAKRMKERFSFDTASLEILGRFFSVTVLFISLLIILQLLGLNIAPLIAFGGIGAAALGFASKDVISNFFGALMLYATRPFITNDWIEIPDKKIMGNVEHIGWYHTVIRDLQKRPIYIPNATFPISYLINWSRITHRRIDEVIVIRSEDGEKVLSIVEAIRSFFEHHAEIDQHQPLNVFFQSYRDSSLEILIQAYTLSTRYDEFMETKQKTLLEIKKIIEKAGAEIARPIMKVEMDQAVERRSAV